MISWKELAQIDQQEADRIEERICILQMKKELAMMVNCHNCIFNNYGKCANKDHLESLPKFETEDDLFTPDTVFDTNRCEHFRPFSRYDNWPNE